MCPSESQIYVRHNPYTRVFTLGFDVRGEKDSQRVAWTCTLMELFEHERDLNRGRFDHFVWPTQEHVISLRIHHKALPWLGNITERVEWIAERVDTPWSLTLTVHDVQEATFHFSFADLGVAMMFKLVYA